MLVLPATTLTEGCYDNMFTGCKGIEKAPELPAPKLEKGCYQEMFYDCAKLNHVKCLATDIKAENSTKDWLGKAGTEATSKPVLESVLDMKAGSDDGVPEAWTAKKIVLVQSVTLGKTELVLVVGEADVTLTATVLPEDATDATVTWTSSNPAVATVTALGNMGTVHAVSDGNTTITAMAGDVSATCTVTVKLAGDLKFKESSIEKYFNSSPFINELTVVGDGTVSYESSNTNVASVDASTGKVTIAAGATAGQTVTITATASETEKYSGASDSYTLTIIDPTGQGERENYGPGSW